MSYVATPPLFRHPPQVTPISSRGAGVIDTGQLIAGHYRLVEHVGSGAMGIVWRAIDERLERSVAVKQILTQPGLSEAERQTVRQRAMREAKNAARFQHPNAIVVFDIAEHEGDPCLVMEYLPSRSLSAILAEHEVLPIKEVAKIGEQVAAALVAAHRAGIVHRDIKPGNLLIDDNGTCKITDFGISRASGDLTLTQTGLIGGTPAYLAPELARGADPTPASDVFALGATLYQAIEGIPPYGDSTNQLALLYSAANGKLNPPTQAGPATALLMSLLRTDAEERPTMSEARERLAALAHSAGNGTAGVGSIGSPSATLVSPSVGAAGGPRPAAAPWQRAGSAAPATSDSPPPTAGGLPPQPSPAPRQESSGRRRKPLVFGAIGGVVVLIAAAVLLIALNAGGDDQNAQGAGTPTSQAPTSSQSAPSSRPESSKKQPSDSPVGWGPAGNRVIDFYSDPEGSWDMLSPAVQSRFGSEDKYKDYWDDQEIAGFQDASAYKRANNSDGSVDIRVTVNFSSGSKQMYLRVVDSGGTLLIDSDPRPDRNTQQ